MSDSNNAAPIDDGQLGWDFPLLVEVYNRPEDDTPDRDPVPHGFHDPAAWRAYHADAKRTAHSALAFTMIEGTPRRWLGPIEPTDDVSLIPG
jgi:hypothetical protein